MQTLFRLFFVLSFATACALAQNVGEIKQLLPSNHPVITPKWSPDGTRLLYTSYSQSGFADIYQYDFNSYQRTVFVRLQGTNMGGRFSPNGRQVAMVLTGEGNSEI